MQAHGVRSIAYPSQFRPGISTCNPSCASHSAARSSPAGPMICSKIGTRNAMVISVAGLCLQVDEDGRTIRVALGSVGPTVLRANGAERFAAQAMTTAGAWDEPGAPVGPDAVEGFAERASAAAEPVDDVRGTAAYRRHACRVLARRAFEWALRDRLDAGVG